MLPPERRYHGLPVHGLGVVVKEWGWEDGVRIQSREEGDKIRGWWRRKTSCTVVQTEHDCWLGGVGTYQRAVTRRYADLTTG